MKKLLLLITVLFLALPFISKAEESSKLVETITDGKWINRSDGYVASPTFDASVDKKEDFETAKRYKTLTFSNDYSFTMDSLKQRYTGTWTINGGNLVLNFNPKTITHLNKNRDPNTLDNSYVTNDEVMNLGERTLQVKDGKLSGDGFVYKNYSGAISGLFNFYEFSGFANVSWKHLLMMFIGFIFIFLAIKYDFEPLLLVPIGFGILIGNIPMFQAVDFNLKLGIYEPGSVMNILYQGVLQGWYPPSSFFLELVQ